MANRMSRREREMEREVEHQARMAARAAVALGFCPSCGEHVDVPAGRLHDAECPDVEPPLRPANQWDAKREVV